MKKNLGVYIHIPFCARKCSYCDFYSLAGCKKLMPSYQKALIHHIKESSIQLDSYYIDTVYFGGGTPSFYGADRIVGIFDTLKSYGNVMIDSEVTVEVNPDSVNLRDMMALKRAGINRISMGIQSANDEMLTKIGRLHNWNQAVEAFKTIRDAGFMNISVDVMYGLPNQTKEDWADTLNKVISLNPEHISCYALKLAEGTPMYVLKDSPFIPNDDIQADMYLFAVEMLQRCGYRQYEISNFAKKGFISRHNVKYWTGDEYIGFGAAAHSFAGNIRYNNIPNVEEYVKNIFENGTVVEKSEKITASERAAEYLMLGLRTTAGICEDQYRRIYSSDFSEIERKLTDCIKHGWVQRFNDRFRLTPEGFLLSNVLIGNVLEIHYNNIAAGKHIITGVQRQEKSEVDIFDDDDLYNLQGKD